MWKRTHTTSWVEGNEFAVVDFNITRKCFDYERNYNNWMPLTRVPDEQFSGLRAPIVAVKMPQTIF